MPKSSSRWRPQWAHLMVDHILQFHPAIIIKLKELIDSGVLDSSSTIALTVWNIGKLRSREHTLEFAPHTATVILSLVEEMPKKRQCLRSGLSSGKCVRYDRRP